MPEDADELRLLNTDVDVLHRDEGAGFGGEDLGEAGQLERNDETHKPAFSTATDENDGGGSCRVRSGRARDAWR